MPRSACCCFGEHSRAVCASGRNVNPVTSSEALRASRASRRAGGVLRQDQPRNWIESGIVLSRSPPGPAGSRPARLRAVSSEMPMNERSGLGAVASRARRARVSLGARGRMASRAAPKTSRGKPHLASAIARCAVVTCARRSTDPGLARSPRPARKGDCAARPRRGQDASAPQRYSDQRRSPAIERTTLANKPRNSPACWGGEWR